MGDHLQTWSEQYGAALECYLRGEREAVLEQAYELGRKAIAEGLGVLDMARVHQQALAARCLPGPQTARSTRALQASETFLMETLSPFEATHRGFRQANLELQQLNNVLERRNRELARINRQLEREVNERRRTEVELRRSEESLRGLSSQILHVQEEERKRISRELHDEVGQALTAVSTNLAMLLGKGAAEAPHLQEKVTEAQALLRQTMEAVHRFARELRPAMLDELGLVPALRSYLKSFAERTGLRVHFSPGAQAERLDDEGKIVVFRVAQESLTNVVKHAQATQVTVTLEDRKGGVRMRVRDDGRAFEVGSQPGVNGKRRLGLVGMQERVRLVDGRFAITSAPGKGTTVSVEIPFRSGRSAAATTATELCKK